MLARIPSYRPSVGSKPSSFAHAADVAGDRVLELAEHVERLHIPTRGLQHARSRCSRRRRRARGRRGGTPGDREALGRRGPRAPSRGSAELVRLGIGDPVRMPGAAPAPLGAQHALHEVPVNTIERRCVPSPDQREAAAPHGREELRLASRLVGPVEPGRSQDDRRRDRPGRGCAAPAARPRASSRRSRGTGGTGESSSKRSVGSGVRAEGRVRRHVHEAAAPTRRARSSTSCVPPTFTSKSSRTGARDGSPRRCGTPRTAPTPSNSASIDTGSRTSPATTSMRSGRAPPGARLRRWCDEAPRMRSRPGSAASARTRFWPSHPTPPDHRRRRARAQLVDCRHHRPR